MNQPKKTIFMHPEVPVLLVVTWTEGFKRGVASLDGSDFDTSLRRLLEDGWVLKPGQHNEENQNVSAYKG